MKQIYIKKIWSFFIFFIFYYSGIAQVGIGTTSPKGILDIESTTQGLVLPRVSLTKSNLATPIVNPAGGGLAIGTVVYNTNTTYTGSYDVSPGIYMWNGNDWINEFPKKHAQIYKQSAGEFRTTSTGGYVDIPNLGSQNITARYTGTYKIEVNVNYGGGHVQNLAGGDTNPLSQKGNFKFTFNGVDEIFPLSSQSTYGTTQYYLIWEQATIVLYRDLVAGNVYSFALQFDQLDSPGFINSGNSGTGRGYIGYDIPCSVEFIFLD